MIPKTIGCRHLILMESLYKNPSSFILFGVASVFFSIVLCGCSSKVDELPLYDQVPDMGEPPVQTTFARELNYDILDYESYDSFKKPQVVEVPDGKKLGFSWIRLYRCENATYLTETYFVPQDYYYFQYSSKAAIIDTETGDNYMLRKLMYYPTDTCFWIRGCGGQYVQMISVYPPLPLEVENIELFTPAQPSRDTFDGQATRYSGLKVSELRRSTLKDNILKKGEVIY